MVINANGTVTYTPSADFNGSDSYTYTVTSGGVTETATVNVTVSAVADIAADSATTSEDQAITTDVLANDSFEGTPAVTAVTQGTHGSVVINANGTVTYTPSADFNGSDSYTYTVTSGGVTETATVNVTVSAVADNADDSAQYDVSRAGWVSLNALQNAPSGAPQTAPRGELVTFARELVAKGVCPNFEQAVRFAVVRHLNPGLAESDALARCSQKSTDSGRAQGRRQHADLRAAPEENSG